MKGEAHNKKKVRKERFTGYLLSIRSYFYCTICREKERKLRGSYLQ